MSFENRFREFFEDAGEIVGDLNLCTDLCVTLFMHAGHTCSAQYMGSSCDSVASIFNVNCCVSAFASSVKMGVGETSDVVMQDVEHPEEHEGEGDKLDTVVLPEGVCLLDKSFVVIERDPDGKKFDKGALRLKQSPSTAISVAVSRYICRSFNAPLEMLLDVNVDVYPLKVNSVYNLSDWTVLLLRLAHRCKSW